MVKRKALRTTARICFTIALAAAGTAARAQTQGKIDTQPPQTSFEDRMVWWNTRDHVLDIGGLSPLEVVKGAPGAPIVQTARPTLAPKAAQAAIAYVSPMNTESLLVWQGGALQLEWYGPGFGPDSQSLPASMMKPVMTLALGQAIAQGKIKSVDEPVSDFLPEWANDPRGRITIRQVLQMNSGLQKDAATSGGGRGAQLMLGVDMEPVLLDAKLVAAPGTIFDYNNTNPSLLGVILQRATGERYAQWLSETIWKPIGAKDGYVWLDGPGGLARTACCYVATGGDWLRLGLLIKNKGQVDGKPVVDPAWIEAMIAPSPNNPNFGYNVWRASPYLPHRGYGVGTTTVPAAKPFLAADMVYFDGAVGERVYISRARDLVIVRIGSSAPAWDDSVLPNIIVEGLPK